MNFDIPSENDLIKSTVDSHQRFDVEMITIQAHINVQKRDLRGRGMSSELDRN